MRVTVLGLVWAVAGCVSPGSTSEPLAGPADKEPLAPPVLTVVDATKTTITVRVCGGAGDGAPAGFSLHWTGPGEYFCAASYSGQPPGSRYALDAGECVDVVVDGHTFGDLPDDPGSSSGCTLGLECDTEYEFTAFAHADRDHFKSDDSEPVIGTTDPCEVSCTRGHGYWKNHEEAWPVDTLTLGTVEYNKDQLLAILRQPVKGNGLVSLAHQLIAALLNGGAGVEGLIDEANALIGDLVVPPVGGGSLEPSATSEIADALDAYNNGDCDDEDEDDYDD